MEAVAEGVYRPGRRRDRPAAGYAVPGCANPFLTHVIATGIGEARNAIIARSAFCLVAIGNSHGTLSEVAFGLQFGKRCSDWRALPSWKGERCADAQAALEAVARLVLGSTG